MMTQEELKETRKQMFDKMEKHLWEDKKPEDSVFYYHPSEDRIVLSHALFLVMTSTIKGKVARQKHLLLLPNLYDISNDKVARRLAATFIVAGGYGGDMKEELADDILDDMDFVNNKVKCRKIEEMMPRLDEFVTKEMKSLFYSR